MDNRNMQKQAKSIAFLVSVMCANPASSHNFWSNGEPVPEFVKSSCCGVADAHHIKHSAIHIMADGYHIDGINTVVPISRALPSMDGEVWAFWNPIGEPDPMIYCLFVPFNGT